MCCREEDELRPVPRSVGRNVGRFRTHVRIWEDGDREGLIKIKEKQIKNSRLLCSRSLDRY